VKRCRVRGCRTVLTSYNHSNASERLCYRHLLERNRMRFLQNMPGSDQLTAAERRHWLKGEIETTEP